MIINGFHACDARYFSGHRRGLGVRVAAGCSSPELASAASPSSATTTPGTVRVSVTDTGMGLTHGDLVNNLSAYDGDDHTLSQVIWNKGNDVSYMGRQCFSIETTCEPSLIFT
jgi:hypothetical protein